MNFIKAGRLATAIVALVLIFSFSVRPDRTNYSGKWILNEGKSELGNFGRFAARTINIEQKEDAITIAKTATSFNGDEVTSTETLTYDGKEAESTVFGSSKKKSVAKWSDDGKTLSVSYTIFFERDGQSFEIKGTETWQLGDDGKSLTLSTVSTSPQGERSTKAVYDKG